MAVVDMDPTGPAGVYGYGRCARCGESFHEEDEQAEVVGTTDDPASLILDSIVIHADCYEQGKDVLA